MREIWEESGDRRRFLCDFSTSYLPSPPFEANSVERSLQEMDGAVVGVDDEFAIVPVRVVVSADQKLQGEMFEDEIVGGFKFVIGKWTEDGAGFGDVLDE